MAIKLGMQWHTLLPGFRVRVRPFGDRVRQEASQAYTLAKAEAEEEGATEAEALRRANAAYARAAAITAIVDWQSFDPANPEAVVDLDILDPAGNPAEVTADNILMLMDYAPSAEAFEVAYVLPFLADMRAKNGFSPSSNGNSGQVAAKAIAETAPCPADSAAAKNG